jgi:hypothetical protein
MKKYLLLITFAVCSFCFAKAQDEDAAKRAEKIEALKIAFITEKLGLSTAEAQKFWPVYNQYDNEIKSVFRNNKDGDVIENDERLLNVRKKYRPEFEKVLGRPRMNKLYSTEKDFRKLLFQHIKKNNQQRPKGHRR